MTTLQTIVGLTTYDLSNDVTYVHFGNDGFGLPPVDRLIEQGPLQDGTTDIGYRLQARPVTLVLALAATTQSGYFAKRKEIANIFKPRTSPIYLRFTDPAGNVFQLDTYYQNGLSFDSNDKGALGPYSHKVGIVLNAPDPLWYNPTQQIYTYTVGAAASGGFTFPLIFPVTFGSNTVNQTQTITYAGTYQTSPIIEIHGPITDCVITNLTTGILLDFTGTTIADGVVYTVDTRYGYIAVTQDNGTNRIDKLVGQSNLSGFKLVADPDAVNGNNDIKVTGTAANANTAIYIRYYERYIGI